MDHLEVTSNKLKNIEQVLYAGNHYISLPEIRLEDGAIKGLNLVSISNRALIDLAGDDMLFRPLFYKDGKELAIRNHHIHMISYYIPYFHFELEDNLWIDVKIYADLKEKGFVYEFESSEPLDVVLVCDPAQLSLLRASNQPIDFDRKFFINESLKMPGMALQSNRSDFALAFGSHEHFTYKQVDDLLFLNLHCDTVNSFYIALHAETDGASNILLHMKKKGYETIYAELKAWLDSKSISYPKDRSIEKFMNKNLFFNYFFAIGKDFDEEDYISLSSRSPRYHHVGTVQPKEVFQWILPAIKLIDERLYLTIIKDLFLRYSKGIGAKTLYIDGAILEPGFYLHQATCFLTALPSLKQHDFDGALLQTMDAIYVQMEEAYTPSMSLYKTCLCPESDESTFSYLMMDNVQAWHGLKLLRNTYVKLGRLEKINEIQERIDAIDRGIKKHLVRRDRGRALYAWSCDHQGDYNFYNGPNNSLALLPYLGYATSRDPLFKNTIDYLYSYDYPYFSEDRNCQELPSSNRPDDAPGIGLCSSLLNPLKSADALNWLKSSQMDDGLLTEYFNPNTGAPISGRGFAAGCGYLGHVLCEVMIKNQAAWLAKERRRAL